MIHLIFLHNGLIGLMVIIMNNYNRIKSIIYGKMVDKTMDKDYSEISEELFGKHLASDECRKRCYGAKAVIDAVEHDKVNNIIDSNEILQEIEEKRLELEKERKKLQATKIEYNRNLRTESRFELFYENIKEAIQRLEVPNFKRMNVDSNDKKYVLNFSDIHYASTFKSINNEYSREICHNRFNLMAEKTIKFAIENNVDKMLVINNSDTIQGMLRISDVKLNDIPVVESVVEVSQLLAKFLNKLSEYIEVEYIHVPMANHSQIRPLGTKASELPAEDMEKIIVNYVADLCDNNERIFVHREYKSDNVQFKIFDFECIALHGHQIRNIKNSLKDLSQLHRKFYSFVFLGHYHNSMNYTANEQDTYNAEILVAPSIVGSCQYSDKLMVGGKSMDLIGLKVWLKLET